MLEKADYTKTISKEMYKDEIDTLKIDLTMLQQKIIGAKIPVIIILEGFGAAGKGAAIASLILNFDPRGFDVYTTVKPDKTEKRKPWITRFIKQMPKYGDMAIYDGSWYLGMLEISKDKKDEENFIDDINTYEEQLTNDGYLILKYFLDIDKKTQKNRFKKLLSNKKTSWRVSKEDLEDNKNYDKIAKKYYRLMEKTDRDNAKWNVIPALDARYVRYTLFKSIKENLECALAKRQIGISRTHDSIYISPNFNLIEKQDINSYDLSQTISDEDYKTQLDELQTKLGKLHNVLYQKKIPMILAYEGHDAAGKGGNIKRVARALDPRGYAVAPFSAPTPYELAHHYLFRFVSKLPKDGHIEIFDRTWYGRVLVERVEQLTPQYRLQEAYNEINQFEYMLKKWGAIILKFFVTIDKDEQLRRFEARQNTPEKQWKITDEDWRNRDKWDAYTEAINDMFKYTNTDFAPWHIIESNNKHFARIKTLNIIIKAIEDRI